MADEIDDDDVRRRIGQALLVAPGVNVSERLGNAWQALKAERRTAGGATNVNLAAAEHYLYARFLASVTGDSAAAALPLGYYLKKKIYFLLGKEASLRTDPSFPSLAPQFGTVVWGQKGVNDGLGDYHREHSLWEQISTWQFGTSFVESGQVKY